MNEEGDRRNAEGEGGRRAREDETIYQIGGDTAIGVPDVERVGRIPFLEHNSL